MPVTFESVRFGTVEIETEDVIEFPFGLIGLGGLRYALIDRNPGTGFLWLHALDDPALALPVVSPHRFFPDFSSGTCWKPTVRPSPVLDSTTNCPSPIVASTCTSSSAHQNGTSLPGSVASMTRKPTEAGIWVSLS